MSSIQDRKDKDNFRAIFNSMISFVKEAEFELPEYRADSRKRDKKLLEIVRSENLLSGVLSSVVSRDVNRSWSLTGGIRLIGEYGRKLHSFEDNSWRRFISKMSQAYYSTNLGFAGEVGRDIFGVPETIWAIDPTRLTLDTKVNKVRYPLVYYSTNVAKVGLNDGDFIHGNSLPALEEEMGSLGFCAVERSIDVARILIGLFAYHIEKLGFAPPKGMALIKGVLDDEWEQAKANAEEELNNGRFNYYKGILALFTENTNADVKLIGFSELPDNFEFSKFIDFCMQSYALAFNYDVSEFYSIDSGSFGKGKEHELQQKQATVKGELAFSLALQEQLQYKFLPKSVIFEFDTRNDSGDLVKQQVQTSKLDNYIKIKEQGVIDDNQFQQLIASEGFIPKEWLQENYDKDTQDLVSIRSNPVHREYARKYPSEPIARYTFDPILGGTTNILFESGDDLLKKKYY